MQAGGDSKRYRERKREAHTAARVLLTLPLDAATRARYVGRKQVGVCACVSARVRISVAVHIPAHDCVMTENPIHARISQV